MLYSVSIYDYDYSYKTRRKLCYFCGVKVKSYKAVKCKCNNKDTCELCKEGKASNIPICNNCSSSWVSSQKGKKVKDKKDKKGK